MPGAVINRYVMSKLKSSNSKQRAQSAMVGLPTLPPEPMNRIQSAVKSVGSFMDQSNNSSNQNYMIQEFYNKKKIVRANRPFSCFVKKGSRWANIKDEQSSNKLEVNVIKNERLFSGNSYNNEHSNLQAIGQYYQKGNNSRIQSSLPYNKRNLQRHGLHAKIHSAKNRQYEYDDITDMEINGANLMMNLQEDSVSQSNSDIYRMLYDHEKKSINMTYNGVVDMYKEFYPINDNETVNKHRQGDNQSVHEIKEINKTLPKEKRNFVSVDQTQHAKTINNPTTDSKQNQNRRAEAVHYRVNTMMHDLDENNRITIIEKPIVQIRPKKGESDEEMTHLEQKAMKFMRKAEQEKQALENNIYTHNKEIGMDCGQTFKQTNHYAERMHAKKLKNLQKIKKHENFDQGDPGDIQNSGVESCYEVLDKIKEKVRLRIASASSTNSSNSLLKNSSNKAITIQSQTLNTEQNKENMDTISNKEAMKKVKIFDEKIKKIHENQNLDEIVEPSEQKILVPRRAKKIPEKKIVKDDLIITTPNKVEEQPRRSNEEIKMMLMKINALPTSKLSELQMVCQHDVEEDEKIGCIDEVVDNPQDSSGAQNSYDSSANNSRSNSPDKLNKSPHSSRKNVDYTYNVQKYFQKSPVYEMAANINNRINSFDFQDAQGKMKVEKGLRRKPIGMSPTAARLKRVDRYREVNNRVSDKAKNVIDKFSVNKPKTEKRSRRTRYRIPETGNKNLDAKLHIATDKLAQYGIDQNYHSRIETGPDDKKELNDIICGKVNVLLTNEKIRTKPKVYELTDGWLDNKNIHSVDQINDLITNNFDIKLS